MWTIRIMPSSDGPPHLWKTTTSMDKLVRTNARLAVCFAVAAAVMSEGEACAYLGLDRVTFREIYGAAERWAEEMQHHLHDGAERGVGSRVRAEGDEPVGSGGGEPPPAGVPGPRAGVEGG